MKNIQTLSSLAASYNISPATLKTHILFFKDELLELGSAKARIYNPSQVKLFYEKLGIPTGVRHTLSSLAELYGMNVKTFIYTWVEPFKAELMQLQPTPSKVLTPKQVKFLESVFDKVETEIR